MKTIAEIRAALVDLIAQIDDDNNYSIFNYYGKEFRIPKGWCMARDDNGDYTLVDASHVTFGKVRRTTEGHAWAYIDRDPVDAQYTDSIRAALRGLIARAWGSADAAR